MVNDLCQKNARVRVAGEAPAGWGEGRLSEDYPVPGGLAAGSRVAGYRVEEPLGAGGMAVVYRARDERLRRLVALKVLAPALAADEEFRWRFTAESRAAAAVDHPNIIPVYEAGQAGRALFIAMRLVTGGDLRGVLAREGPLAPERMAGLLSPVASALDAAHGAGLVHRDVKPANVLVDTGPGRPEHVYLSDFGISKGAASSARLTGTGQFLGTPAYTSPEQVKGLAVDGRADQYALACVAWQLLTGTVPFQRDQGMAVLLAHLSEPPPPLAALRPGLPAAAGQVLARAMAKDPGERYPSCGEFTDALRDALALPPYQPAVPDPAAAGLLAARASALPASTVTTAPGAGRGAGGTDPHPDPGLPAAAADGPTQDTAAPGQRLRPRPGPDGPPARPARRRRYLTITLACTLLAGATALSVLLATPGAPQPPTRPHTSTPPGTLSRPRPATPTVSETKPATLSQAAHRHSRRHPGQPRQPGRALGGVRPWRYHPRRRRLQRQLHLPVGHRDPPAHRHPHRPRRQSRRVRRVFGTAGECGGVRPARHHFGRRRPERKHLPVGRRDREDHRHPHRPRQPGRDLGSVQPRRHYPGRRRPERQRLLVAPQQAQPRPSTHVKTM